MADNTATVVIRPLKRGRLDTESDAAPLSDRTSAANNTDMAVVVKKAEHTTVHTAEHTIVHTTIATIAPLIPCTDAMPVGWALPAALSAQRMDLIIKRAIPGMPTIWNIYSVALGLLYSALNVNQNVPVLGSQFNADLSEIRCVPIAHRCGVLLDITATASAEKYRLILWVMVLNEQLLVRPCHGVPRIDIYQQVLARCRWVLQRAQMLDTVAPRMVAEATSTEVALAASPPLDLLIAGGAAAETTAEERVHIATISTQASASDLISALQRLRDLLYVPETEARLAPIALYYVRRLCCHGDDLVRATALDLIGTLSL